LSARQHGGRIGVIESITSQGVFNHGGLRSRIDSFAGNIRHHYCTPIAGYREHIVEIAAQHSLFHADFKAMGNLPVFEAVFYLWKMAPLERFRDMVLPVIKL